MKNSRIFLLFSNSYLALCALLTCVSCAPQREDFTSKQIAEKVKKEKEQTLALSRNTSYSDGSLEIAITPEQEKALIELSGKLETSAITPQCGMFRVYSEKHPLMGITTKKRDVFALENGEMVLQTIQLDGGKVISSKKDFDKPDFIQSLTLMFSNLKEESNRAQIYQQVKKYLNLFYRDRFDVSQNYKISIKVNRARFYKSSDGSANFYFTVSTLPTDHPDLEPLAFETRFRPELPKAFQCFYKAWGKVKPTQILFYSKEFGAENTGVKEICIDSEKTTEETPENPFSLLPKVLEFFNY